MRDTDWLIGKRGFTYFNAGHLIITPDAAEFEWLLQNYKKAQGREFAEQDLLNDRYRGKWHELQRACNHILPFKADFLKPQGIAFHAKTWEISPTWLPEGVRISFSSFSSFFPLC